MASASFSIPRECISKDAIDLPKDLETALRGSAPSSSWYSCELLPSGELRDAHMCPQPGSSDSFYLSVPRGLPEVLLRPDLPGIIIAERRGQQVLTIMPLPAAPPTAASAAAAAGSTAAGGAAAGGADACTGAVATAERRGKRKHSSSPAQRPAMPRASDEAQQGVQRRRGPSGGGERGSAPRIRAEPMLLFCGKDFETAVAESEKQAQQAATAAVEEDAGARLLPRERREPAADAAAQLVTLPTLQQLQALPAAQHPEANVYLDSPIDGWTYRRTNHSASLEDCEPGLFAVDLAPPFWGGMDTPGSLHATMLEAGCQAGAQFPLHVRRCSGNQAAADAPSMEVVAVADIAAGSCICEFGGEYLATRDEMEEAAAAAAAAGERCCIFELVPQRMRLAAGRYGTAAAGIDARKVGNAAEFMLHCSKEANVRAFEVRQHYGQPRVICFASRVVRRGEALTLDICPE